MAAAEPQVGLSADVSGTTTTGAPTASAPAPASQTTPETVTREQYDREMDRQRDRYGKTKARVEELEKSLAELTESQKSEAQRLAERAAKADEYEPRVKELEAAFEEEVKAQVATLSEPMQKLLPANLAPRDRLAWVRQAREAEKAITPNHSLPDVGGRVPTPGGDDKKNFEEAAAMFPTLGRLTTARRGP